MRILRKIVALSVLPGVLLTGYAMGRASMATPVETTTAVHLKAYHCGNEDSKNWHAAICGNRSMGVKIDVTPNNPHNGKRWVILKFNKDGKTGTFKPRKF